MPRPLTPGIIAVGIAAILVVVPTACSSGDSEDAGIPATTPAVEPIETADAIPTETEQAATPTTPTDPRTLTGTWTASDGQTISFGSDGRCDNAYYVNGEPFDIGGPMYCALSTAPDSAGRYRLIVRQASNKATYSVEFIDADSASVYDREGALIYRITRF
ncbi:MULTISPECIES: hypothetical protein [Gordonia]|uniref:hypothetical protein n=1 Tax=Gordonia TaxID=2053 RepID=UPI0011153A45|nr:MULTISPECIES: hypothetical protein [Gordonia]MDH3018419.1 hypothetical protein [Gordonia alkanivorans]MDJ0008969.1 hypothetical protein [Gordonia alkanivorans]MDJ0098088.1 hypothetical protein [Gordonia alkanivorans]MDJ0494544.1 hypothetical protein [Gordonia alkanivorans]